MTLRLTPEMLETLHDFLCTTPPFKKWKLPTSDEIKLVISGGHDYFAKYRWDGKQHVITVSDTAVGHTITLIETYSHELIHLHLEIKGQESRRGGPSCHNKYFRRFAAQVCRYHGFDPKAFY